MAKENIAFKGNPVTLLGSRPRTGQKAPDFHALDHNLHEVSLGDFKGKVKVISVVLSVDTPVCHKQLVRFNEEAAKLGQDVAVLNISMDLPFAIARFMKEESIERTVVLSDHRDASFGRAYGLLIDEMRLLARSVIIIDKDETISYFQVVQEQTEEPDYERAMKEAEKLLVRVA
ncbi:MAG: thiol peroxidase [Nitrospiraceae bacterium]|nr:thiol peroxidase [Nitrospiraceae bacterium]